MLGGFGAMVDPPWVETQDMPASKLGPRRVRFPPPPI